ncbi:MAG TPA: ion transporter [Thermoanaerobaculia bacterium]|nr:ion transporter [Thermoanaerobaculia bacterium]
MAPLRERVRRIIFEHDTPAGRAFDLALIVAITVSVLVVMLDSVARLSGDHPLFFRRVEWVFTILFTVEYIARVWSAGNRRAYVLSFFGAVDLLAILPTYLALLFPETRFLAVIRILRVLRVFRILKLAQFVGEAGVLGRAIRASGYKITVFLFTVLTAVVVVGSMMYMIEGPQSGFTSIPESIYWAIVTMTTVGYGDIAPVTTLGKTLAAMLMITGYGIIAVPTGIVTVELDRATRANIRQCPGCSRGWHERTAKFCADCGAKL